MTRHSLSNEGISWIALEITMLSTKSETRFEVEKVTENTMKSGDFTRATEMARPITVRFTPQIAEALEAEAQRRGVTTTEVVREIVTERFKRAAPNRTNPARYGQQPQADDGSWVYLLGKGGEERQFQQLIYEITKTRSALMHFASNTLPGDNLEELSRAAARDAKAYTSELVAAMKNAGENGDARGW
jgi:hypothetical protein